MATRDMVNYTAAAGESSTWAAGAVAAENACGGVPRSSERQQGERPSAERVRRHARCDRIGGRVVKAWPGGRIQGAGLVVRWMGTRLEKPDEILGAGDEGRKSRQSVSAPTLTGARKMVVATAT